MRWLFYFLFHFFFKGFKILIYLKMTFETIVFYLFFLYNFFSHLFPLCDSPVSYLKPFTDSIHALHKNSGCAVRSSSEVAPPSIAAAPWSDALQIRPGLSEASVQCAAHCGSALSYQNPSLKHKPATSLVPSDAI